MVIEWQRGTFRYNEIASKIRDEFGNPKWAIFLIFGAFGVVWLAATVSYPQYITVVAMLTASALLGFTAIMAYLRRHPGAEYIIITVGIG